MAILLFIIEFISGILGKTAQDFIKEKLAKYKTKKYIGDLSDSTAPFTDFLYANEDKTIFLDVILTDEQNQEMIGTNDSHIRESYYFSIPYDLLLNTIR